MDRTLAEVKSTQTSHQILFVKGLARKLHLRSRVTSLSRLQNDQSLCAVWGVIDWWVCVEVANGILWWVLTPRLTCTVLHASFNAWIMVIECSEVRLKCSRFLTTTPLLFSRSVTLSSPFSHLSLSHLFPLLYWHFLPPCLVYFISNEVGGELYQCDCRVRVADRRQTKELLECFANDGPTQDSKWLQNIPDIWSILCAAEHNDCFHFAFSELCHRWKEFYYADFFYFYNRHYTFKCGSHNISPDYIYIHIPCCVGYLAISRNEKKLFQFILGAKIMQHPTVSGCLLAILRTTIYKSITVTAYCQTIHY